MKSPGTSAGALTFSISLLARLNGLLVEIMFAELISCGWIIEGFGELVYTLARCLAFFLSWPNCAYSLSCPGVGVSFCVLLFLMLGSIETSASHFLFWSIFSTKFFSFCFFSSCACSASGYVPDMRSLPTGFMFCLESCCWRVGTLFALLSTSKGESVMPS